MATRLPNWRPLSVAALQDIEDAHIEFRLGSTKRDMYRINHLHRRAELKIQLAKLIQAGQK